MTTIGIVGLGLIGGSLGLDFRALGHRVLGVSRQARTCELAVTSGAADQASVDPALLAEASIIFLCTPIGALQATTKQLIPHLAPETILTDVGSVKQAVVERVQPLWPRFLGGHPMAGTAETGILAAERHLFANRSYVLTPTPETEPGILSAVRDLVQSLGCQVHQCTPAAHDRAVAWISHLPILVSGSLIAACLRESDPTILQLAQTFASSGFRDTSRVGGGNPELGRMVAQYNQDALLSCLYGYQDTLAQWIQVVEQSDWDTLEAMLQHNQQARPGFVE